MQASVPDEGGVEFCVHKHHHLKGHGDAQASDAGHCGLQPEQTCIKQRNKFVLLAIELMTDSLLSQVCVKGGVSLSVPGGGGHDKRAMLLTIDGMGFMGRSCNI